MSFDSGTVSFRVFRLSRDLPGDHLERFKAHVPPALEYVQEQTVYGWVTGRHLLDRQIDESNAMLGGYLRLTLLQAERKVPTSLLRAEIRQEELVRQTINGGEPLHRRERAEIKQEIVDRLLPQMPPQLKGYTWIHRLGQPYLFAETLSEKVVDVFVSQFREAIGFTPDVVTPESAARISHHADVTHTVPCSFSPEVDDERVSSAVGCDFLTWLWFRSEGPNEAVPGGRAGKVGLLVEGPLTFVMEGGGAHETVLRKGNPPISSEAKACLLAGKKLKRAKVSFVRGEQVWQVNFDAETFTFRGVRLPQSEGQLDSVSRFSERAQSLEILMDLVMGLYGEFLALRLDGKVWSRECRKMQDWVVNRNAVH